MPEETKVTEPVQVNAGTPEQGEAKAEKTFTQAELDRIVGQRLRREREGWESEKVETEKRAKMEESQRLAAEKSDLEKQLEAERKARAKTELGLSLADSGRFQNSKRLLILLEAEGLEGFQDPQGALDYDKISKAFPEYAKQQAETPRLPGALPANPGLPGAKATQVADLEAQLNAASAKGQRAIAVNLQRQIEELRRR